MRRLPLRIRWGDELVDDKDYSDIVKPLAAMIFSREWKNTILNRYNGEVYVFHGRPLYLIIM